jgi:HK97 family phage prohead protease
MGWFIGLFYLEGSLKMAEAIYKTFTVEVNDVNEETRSFWAVASTDDIDREGDVLSQEGWEIGSYLKNPVVLFAHRYNEPPIAKANDIKVLNGRLMFKPQFATKEEYPFADTIFKLYKGGYLRSFSVGFIPKEWEHRRTEDGIRGGKYFIKQELVEISAVPVASNPNALTDAYKSGVIGRKEFKNLRLNLNFDEDDGTLSDAEKEELFKGLDSVLEKMNVFLERLRS